MQTPVDSNPAARPINPGAPAAAPAPAAPPAPVPGTPEYDAAMVAKFEAHQQGQGATAPADNQSKPTRPDHIPEKFWDADKGEVKVAEMAKSYAELEKTRSQAPAAKPDVKPEGATDEAAKGADAAANQAAAAAGLDMGALQAEYADKGDLSAESKAALAKVGISDEILQNYIRGQEAMMQQRDAAITATVGGNEEWAKMATWARANLSESEQEAVDQNLRGTLDQAKMAAAGLRARYEASVGKDPQLLGGAQGGGGVGGYASQAEMTKDMRDPKYATDPAFRARVEQKLAVTTAFWQ